ncbi:hypothetical protein TNCV_3197501 [Trichonephila clavipes]|nr:hypothetical protein TNCV_3197501 [Trichonephila clavipes]
MQSQHPEMMTRSKDQSPDENTNLLRELLEKESDGGEMSYSYLDSKEDIRLSESDCKESKESADEIDNIHSEFCCICFLGRHRTDTA